MFIVTKQNNINENTQGELNVTVIVFTSPFFKVAYALVK